MPVGPYRCQASAANTHAQRHAAQDKDALTTVGGPRALPRCYFCSPACSRTQAKKGGEVGEVARPITTFFRACPIPWGDPEQVRGDQPRGKVIWPTGRWPVPEQLPTRRRLVTQQRPPLAVARASEEPARRAREDASDGAMSLAGEAEKRRPRTIYGDNERGSRLTRNRASRTRRKKQNGGDSSAKRVQFIKAMEATPSNGGESRAKEETQRQERGDAKPLSSRRRFLPA